MYDRTTILENIRQIKRKVLPNDRLILFGSQARNEANEESDWDLLIILDKPKREPTDFDTYVYPFVELGWEFNEMINPLLYTTQEWEINKPSLFRKNVQTEGIEIV
ncbi:MAG: nucleotidyltransferase domain-containing protein [Tannerellaceae bacterium]|nr:nucleotidyltransferase domain-containing protein [Tannerellaceae bacterium]